MLADAAARRTRGFQAKGLSPHAVFHVSHSRRLKEMSEWEGYILRDYKIRFDRGSLVLDVGCGPGVFIKLLTERGSSVVGIDIDHAALALCRSQGMSVLYATAEELPFKDSSFDGILCKVVLPFTREEDVISEFGRLLKPGGKCYLQCHGAGYYLNYLLLARSWKRRFYGLRSLVNTWYRVVTGKRLPGFFGDTIYQSQRRLSKYYRRSGLSLVEDTPSKRFLGFTVFTHQILEKIPSDATSRVKSSLAPNTAD